LLTKLRKSVLLCSLLFSSSLLAEEQWILDRFNFYFEDDIYTQTDDGYSAGERLALLYFIENEDYAIYDALFLDVGDTHSYCTLALTNQIFTPTDTQSTALQVDDRPYAGWTYVDIGIHKSSKRHLRSLSLKVGMVGPASGSEHIQNSVHKWIDSDTAKGWDNQLHNELGVNLKYAHKWCMASDFQSNLEWSIIPFVSAELGNVAINALGGFNARFGYDIPKDFGVSSIDIGGEPGIPIYDEYQRMKSQKWSFSFNVTASGSAVARDIFLDGNTFSSSHSVEKENYIYYYGLGFTVRYKSFVFDFLEVHNSERFKKENKGHGVGTMVFSWLF